MKLYHPDDPKNEIDIQRDPGRVDLLKRAGWREVRGKKSSPPAPQPPSGEPKPVQK